ncbi:MAG: hypothetical protein ACOCZR_04775 [Halanaerobiales bacterium]
MRILIDGDACPVIEEAEEIAKQYKLELIIFTDITHQLTSDYAKINTLMKY